MKPIIFHSKEVNLRVTGYLAGSVKPINHRPEGWQTVQRVGRNSFIEWQGSSGYELQIPLLFGLDLTTPVEDALKKMDLLCSTPKNQKDKRAVRTPTFTIQAHGACPHDLTHDPRLVWVVSSMDWDTESAIENNRNKHVRKTGTLTVLEFEAESIANAVLIPPQKGDGNHKDTKTYKVKHGDTLPKIAAKLWGIANLWHDIAKLNKIHDPNHLKVGSVLKIPREHLF